MEQSWRWFGPDDVVPLDAIRQAGASGVVTALHYIPYGEVGRSIEIERRKAQIAAPALGLRWNVVESLPIHERIKLGEGDLSALFDTTGSRCATSPPAACSPSATISCR